MNITDIINSGKFEGFTLKKNGMTETIAISKKHKVILYNPFVFENCSDDTKAFFLIQIVYSLTKKNILVAMSDAIKECHTHGFDVKKIVSEVTKWLDGRIDLLECLEVIAITAANPTSDIIITTTDEVLNPKDGEKFIDLSK